MVTIVDKIKKAAPKWVEPPRPTTFKTTLEREKYWETEKLRWREGYGDGHAHICGMHYFYLREGTLKDGSDGTKIRPKYRDCDEWIIQPLHDAFWNLKNQVGLVKRREIGATSIGAGLLPAYTFKMFPSSTFGATSCDQSRIFKAYSDKTSVFIKDLSQDIRPIYDKTLDWKENSTKQQVYLKLPFYIKNQSTQEFDLLHAELFAKETSESDTAATGFSGTRLRAAYLDEFPLHKRKSKLLGSMQSCVMKGPEQSGLLFWAGTVEESITPEQIGELQTLVRNSEVLKFNVIFAPAWWGLIMDENGISDEKKGIDWVYSERDRLNKLEDKSFLRAFEKNYPLSLDEIFKMSGASRYDEETVERINAQVDIVTKEKPPIIPHDIKIVVKDNAKFIEAEINPKSPIRILEHPQPNVKYLFGYDGISTSKLTSVDDSSKNSMLALVGMK